MVYPVHPTRLIATLRHHGDLSRFFLSLICLFCRPRNTTAAPRRWMRRESFFSGLPGPFVVPPFFHPRSLRFFSSFVPPARRKFPAQYPNLIRTTSSCPNRNFRSPRAMSLRIIKVFVSGGPSLSYVSRMSPGPSPPAFSRYVHSIVSFLISLPGAFFALQRNTPALFSNSPSQLRTTERLSFYHPASPFACALKVPFL